MSMSTSDEFVHLGDTFRRKREEKNLSLKEVENSTSIRLHHLVAIEEGHLSKLISPVYAQGFIKKYATFLELDGEKIIQEHPGVLKMLQPQDVEKEEFAFGLGTLEMRGNQAKNKEGTSNLVWIGLSILIIGSIWFLIRYIGLF